MSIETVQEEESTDAPLLSMDDVEVHYEPGGLIRRLLSSGEHKVKAVDGVSLDIEENDVVAIVGESGCGKTTLGKTAVALQRPTGGSVRFRGQDVWEAKDDRKNADIDHDDIRRSLQIIHQDPGSALNHTRTVLSTLADPLKRWRDDLGPLEREENIYKLLEFLGMTPAQDYANRYPHQLSGGEKQRVALGRALLMSPDLILADEAISALDVSLRVEMMDLMLEIQEEFDTSYLFISHDLANARYLAKKSGGRIGIMYLGHIVEIGTADQILNDPQHPYTQVLRWSTPPLDPTVAREVVGNEPPLRKIDVPDPLDPPSGCNFHPRCPKAREACKEEDPAIVTEQEGIDTACFRVDPDHEYWNSPPVEERRAESAD